MGCIALFHTWYLSFLSLCLGNSCTSHPGRIWGIWIVCWLLYSILLVDRPSGVDGFVGHPNRSQNHSGLLSTLNDYWDYLVLNYCHGWLLKESKGLWKLEVKQIVVWCYQDHFATTVNDSQQLFKEIEQVNYGLVFY